MRGNERVDRLAEFGERSAVVAALVGEEDAVGISETEAGGLQFGLQQVERPGEPHVEQQEAALRLDGGRRERPALTLDGGRQR